MYTYVIPLNYSYIPIQPSEIRATRFRTGFVHEMIIPHSTSFKTNPHLYSTSTVRRYFSSERGETAASAAVAFGEQTGATEKCGDLLLFPGSVET